MRNQCRMCAIRDGALCKALPDPVLGQLNQMSRRRKVRSGAQVIGADQEAPTVATIITGVVRLSKSLPDGRTQIVGLQFPGEFIGRPFAESHGVLAEAATDVELCCFAKPQFEQLLRAHPGMTELFAKRLSNELDEAHEWMLLLGRKTAEEKVASLLLLCAERFQDSSCAGSPRDEIRFDLPLSRTEMADFLGLTLETVGRMLKRLEQTGVIVIHSGRGLTVKSVDALRTRTERDIC